MRSHAHENNSANGSGDSRWHYSGQNFLSFFGLMILDPLSPYHGTAGFKAGGTSAAAAFSVTDDADTLRAECLRLLKNSSGLTADECAEMIGESVLSIRPRISELHKAGHIFKTKLRRKNRSGHSATVWASVL
jgi:hypothetical protein